MTPGSRLLRTMNVIAWLLAIVGVAYVVALVLTPFKPGDRYTGPAAAYLAMAALAVAALLIVGLLVFFIALVRRRPHKWAMLRAFAIGIVCVMLAFAVSRVWIHHQLHQKQKNPGSNAGVASTTGVFGAGTFKIQTSNRPGY
jgi:uncharacterized membrane protein YozB (DUF420 family)